MSALVKLAEQPESVDWMTADDVFIKQWHFKTAFSLVPSHAHKYDHTTAVVAGSVHLWEGNKFIGRFEAPSLILIKAGQKHLFQTMAPHTTLLCIHNGSRPDVAAVLEEHQIVI